MAVRLKSEQQSPHSAAADFEADFLSEWRVTGSGSPQPAISDAKAIAKKKPARIRLRGD